MEATMPLLEATDLWRSYVRGAETIHALAGVSLTVHAGEMVSIVGRSGSGKTTLLNLVGGLDTPTRGTIRLDGREMAGLSEGKLTAMRRDTIGFIFQLFYLIPTLTAVENVELPLLFAREKSRRPRALDALARVGMTAPHALPTQLDGGDLQRVAIARALVRAPKLLLADEPTGRLDPHERDAILAIFHRLQADGLGIILVTHDPALAQEADRVLELADGKVVG